MRYLLDTNACIAILNGSSASVETRVRRTPARDLLLCAIVKSELVYGAHKSAKVAENLQKLETFFTGLDSLPFDDPAAGMAGEIRATLDRQGQQIGPNDLLIASIALAYGLTLVSHNTGEFGRVPGLRLEDWEA